MKVVKDGMFYFIIFFIIFISVLFIKQTIIIENTMNKKYTIELKEKNKEFLNESREKIKLLNLKVTTPKEKECLNEIEKAIDISYEHQTLGTLTYKELISYYYDQEDYYYNYGNIKKSCFTEQEKNKDFTKSVLKPVFDNNTAIIESDFTKKKLLFLLNLTINFKFFGYTDYISDTTTTVNSILEKNELDAQSRAFDNEKTYIKKLLDFVGEKYE